MASVVIPGFADGGAGDILSADVTAIRAAQHRTDGQLQVLVAMAHSHPGSQAAVGPAPAA